MTVFNSFNVSMTTRSFYVGSHNFAANSSVIKFAFEHVFNRILHSMYRCSRSKTVTSTVGISPLVDSSAINVMLLSTKISGPLNDRSSHVCCWYGDVDRNAAS